MQSHYRSLINAENNEEMANTLLRPLQQLAPDLLRCPDELTNIRHFVFRKKTIRSVRIKLKESLLRHCLSDPDDLFAILESLQSIVRQNNLTDNRELDEWMKTNKDHHRQLLRGKITAVMPDQVLGQIKGPS